MITPAYQLWLLSPSVIRYTLTLNIPADHLISCHWRRYAICIVVGVSANSFLQCSLYRVHAILIINKTARSCHVVSSCTKACGGISTINTTRVRGTAEVYNTCFIVYCGNDILRVSSCTYRSSCSSCTDSIPLNVIINWGTREVHTGILLARQT